MASHHLNFTKAALLKAPPASKGSKDYYYDEKEKGLVLAVTPAGSKSFYLYKRVESRPERILLGRFPDMSIENARKAAMGTKGAIAAGKNPQKERRAIRDEMTFGALFSEYLEKYSKVHKRSWAYDEREPRCFLPAIISRDGAVFEGKRFRTDNATSFCCAPRPHDRDRMLGRFWCGRKRCRAR